MKRRQRASRLPLEKGFHCWVQKDLTEDGLTLGRVLDRRMSKQHRESTGSLANISEKDPTLFDFEYYMHYCGMDSRMDEWVTPDRLDLEKRVESPDLCEKNGSKKRRVSSDEVLNDSITSEFDETYEGAMFSSQASQGHQETKNIQKVNIGDYELDAWYYSPYEDDSYNATRETVHLCEFCLKPFKNLKTFKGHVCARKSPPGKEIYRETIQDEQLGNRTLVLFEVNGGGVNKGYCRHLCLMGKLFLEHKSVFYDVDTFNFFILCEEDEGGAHIVGYFSKKKRSKNNLACLVVLPHCQRKGYGKFLVSVSYEISRREENFEAAPETPLSDLAQILYRKYWTYVILQCLHNNVEEERKSSFKTISLSTGIRLTDVRETFEIMRESVSGSVDKVDFRVKATNLQPFQNGEALLCQPERLSWK